MSDNGGHSLADVERGNLMKERASTQERLANSRLQPSAVAICQERLAAIDRAISALPPPHLRVIEGGKEADTEGA